jgi:hypothetical protein
MINSNPICRQPEKEECLNYQIDFFRLFPNICSDLPFIPQTKQPVKWLILSEQQQPPGAAQEQMAPAP